VTGTELEIVIPAATEILGPEVDRLATLHTNARTDRELLAVYSAVGAHGSDARAASLRCRKCRGLKYQSQYETPGVG
jgi:hypothetical protein